jgi:hypothetical protein
MHRSKRVAAPRTIGVLLFVVALVVGACTTASPGGSGATGGASGGASGATKHVAILNKDMTDDEIKAEIAKEGGLVVGNWTYSANSVLIDEFQKYVKATYGADVKLTYEGTQAPSEYLTKLAAASVGGNPAPYDVIAVEENYWADGVTQGLVSDFLPSDLIPNQKLVLDQFQHAPTSIAFQSTAFPAVVYNKTKAPFLKTLKDLANPALKGKITLPAPGDITAGGFLQGRGPDEGGRRLGGHQHRPERRPVHDRPADATAAVRIRRDRRVRVLEQHGPPRVLRWPQGRHAACARDDLSGQRLPLDPEGRHASGPRPGVHQLAAQPGGPVPE